MAGVVVQYPTNVALDRVIQEYMVQKELLIGIKEVMPFENQATQLVEWDLLDNLQGMTASHNVGTDPVLGQRRGSSTLRYAPLYFKQQELIREDEILQRRQLGTLGNVVNIDNLVTRVAVDGIDLDYLRAEYLVWLSLCNFGFTINNNGVIQTETFAFQSFTSAVSWATYATATPSADFNSLKPLARGTGGTLKGAKAYMNSTTASNLLQNDNPADLYGLKGPNFATQTFSIEKVNELLTARSLPTLEEYDEGFYPIGSNDFQTFIPDNFVVVKLRRPASQAQQPGNIALTPSVHRIVNGKEAPGFFSKLEVNGRAAMGSVTIDLEELGSSANPRIGVFHGWYGGPISRLPRSYIIMNVG
jgi:hypothetical protein